MTAPTTRETADHAELARLAEAATKGEWSIDGYQCVCAPDGQIVADYSCCGRGEWEADAAYILAAQPSRVLALLSEIAALRGERTFLMEQKEGAEDAIFNAIARATQAERQRDELRKAMPDISSVIAWLDNGCEPKHAVTELSIYKARIDQALANQGAE